MPVDSPPPRVTWLLLLMTTAAAWVRFSGLDHGLWVDEIFTAVFAAPEHGLTEVAEGPLSSPLPTPPLWFWVVHLTQLLLGTSETAVRLPSLLCGVATIPAIWYVGRRLFDDTVGLVAAGLLVVAPFHVMHSQEARFYPAVILLSLIGLGALLRTLDDDRRLWWVLWTCARIALLYIHLTGFLVLAAELVFLAGIWGRRRRTPHAATQQRQAVIAGLVLGIAYLPMVQALLVGAAGRRGLASEAPQSAVTLTDVLSTFATFGAGPGLIFALFSASVAWGVGAAALHRRRTAWLLACWLITPWLVLLMLRPKHWFAAKYVAPMQPLWLIAAAAGIVTVTRACSESVHPRHRGRLGAALLACLALLHVVPMATKLATLDELRRDDDRWRSIGRLLAAGVDPHSDAVIALPLRLLTMPVDRIMSYYGPGPGDAEVVVTADVEQLRELLAERRRVWVVQDRRVDRIATAEIRAAVDQGPRVHVDTGGRSQVTLAARDADTETLISEIEALRLSTPEIAGSLGKAWRDLDRLDKAAAAYLRAEALDPANDLWPYQRGRVALSQGEGAQAIEAFRRAVHLAPWVPDYHAALAEALDVAGDRAAAIKAYRSALQAQRAARPASKPMDSLVIDKWRQRLETLEAQPR
jgi:tetratricopeptide (TPR) repeat protein